MRRVDWVALSSMVALVVAAVVFVVRLEGRLARLEDRIGVSPSAVPVGAVVPFDSGSRPTAGRGTRSPHDRCAREGSTDQRRPLKLDPIMTYRSCGFKASRGGLSVRGNGDG